MGQQGHTVDDIIRQGEVLFNEGRLDEAEDYLSRLISQYPSESKIKNNLGAIKFLQGDVITAKEYFLSALAVNENDEDAFINLKELYRNQGIWQEFPQSLMDAETITDLYAKAYKLAPQDPGIHNDIGIIQLKAARWDDAEKSFLTAISLDPTYQEAFYNLGRVFMHNERYAEAIDNFIAAAMLNSENEIAKKAIIEYQNEEIIKKIGEKYKSILIVMGKGVEQIVMLTPALKAIKELHPASHITILGNDSALKSIKKCQIIDKVMTQSDDQVYDIAVLTFGSSKFFSQNKTWVNKCCKQVFLSRPLRDQENSDSHFHIARCLGYTKPNPASLNDIVNKPTNNKYQKHVANQRCPKVFCIGYGKTGTTSMARVLLELGYKLPKQAMQESLVVDELFLGNFKPLKELCREYDAFQDMPFSYSVTYAIVDSMFPGSKFILTVREPNEWFESLVRFHLGGVLRKAGVQNLEDFNELSFKNKAIYLHKNYMYNNAKRHAISIVDNKIHYDWSLVYDKEHRINLYVERNREILRYFQNRPYQLLVIDITKEKDTSKIVEFLGLPSEYVRKMPHLNKSKK